MNGLSDTTLHLLCEPKLFKKQFYKNLALNKTYKQINITYIIFNSPKKKIQ